MKSGYRDTRPPSSSGSKTPGSAAVGEIRPDRMRRAWPRYPTSSLNERDVGQRVRDRISSAPTASLISQRSNRADAAAASGSRAIEHRRRFADGIARPCDERDGHIGALDGDDLGEDESAPHEVERLPNVIKREISIHRQQGVRERRGRGATPARPLEDGVSPQQRDDQAK